LIDDAQLNGGTGTSVGSSSADPLQMADIDIRLHDVGDAEFQLQTIKGDDGDPLDAALSHFVRGRLAAETGDTAQAAKEMEALAAAWDNKAVASNLAGDNCWIAPAEEAVGKRDKADAVLQSGDTFVDCYRFKADILDGRDNWPAAQKAYQAAVDLAPDLPAAYYSWGVALFRHDDMAGAKAKLEQASQRGLHWADPLKAWGDVLAKEGNWHEAVAKYDAALGFAPAWAALHKARDEAARHGG
jgi:tetratricopeptide (TPR) repeat protein